MGEKGRAQLVRVERNRILGTMNDINKMRITFAQVTCPTQPCTLLPLMGILPAALATVSAQHHMLKACCSHASCDCDS